MQRLPFRAEGRDPSDIQRELDEILIWIKAEIVEIERRLDRVQELREEFERQKG